MNLYGFRVELSLVNWSKESDVVLLNDNGSSDVSVAKGA